MSRPAARALIVLVALGHATFFIIYQRPDWQTQWADQAGYIMLGRALADTGHFTRYPDAPHYVPEVLRTPGYPFFVALVDRMAGNGHLQVAIAQAGVFAAICLLVYAMARLVASNGVALAAGLVTALYSPLPYYAALTLTEVFTTFLVTLGVYLWLRTLRGGYAIAVAAGVALASASLTRPSFQYLPVALVMFAWVPLVNVPRDGAVRRRSLLMLIVFAAALSPMVLYNVVYSNRITFAPPAAGIGRTLWEGTWQIAFPGRVQATLTRFADTTQDRAALDHSVQTYAAEVHEDAAPMLRYVHQWQDIRRIWDTPRDPLERATARVEADSEYGRVAIENIRRDPVRHIWRRVTRGVVLLWITEIPVRYSDINRLPPVAIRAMWLAQALLMVGAIIGVYVLWQDGARADASALAAVILYVTAVHAVLYSEARYALPAKPVVLLLATVAAARVVRGNKPARAPRGRLSPSQSQTEV